MTNEQLFKEWELFLRNYCKCFPDTVGNRVCDNGGLCDKCLTPDAQQAWKDIMFGRKV